MPIQTLEIRQELVLRMMAVHTVWVDVMHYLIGGAIGFVGGASLATHRCRQRKA